MPIDPNKPFVEVCIAPNNYYLYKEYNDIVVVIDVLRATSAICAAMDSGVEKIIPVATVDEAREYIGKPNHIVAAERNGEIVEGFEYGNSPFNYLEKDLSGKTLVLSTTNGTKAIEIAKDSNTLVIASLLNLDVISEWLIAQKRSTLMLCSGWKDKMNLEDTICAGAIADKMLAHPEFQSFEDSTIVSKYLCRSAIDGYMGLLKSSSHRRRLQKLKMNADIKYCLSPNQSKSIPILVDGALINLNKTVSIENQ